MDKAQINDTTPDADKSPTIEQQFEQQKAQGLHPEPPAPERPEWLPEKFKSPEDMAKAYSELEKKQSNPDEDKPEDNDSPDDKPDASDQEDNKATSPVAVSIGKATAEFEKTGNVTEETIAELEKIGIDRGYIETLVEASKAQDKAKADRNQGQTGLSEDNVADIMALAGGKEGYSEMTAWIADNLSDDEVSAYDDIMDSGNVPLMKSTVEGYVARFNSANPKTPELLQGKTGQGPSVKPYMSVEQVRVDMAKPQYANDPAFRAEVAKRISISKAL